MREDPVAFMLNLGLHYRGTVTCLFLLIRLYYALTCPIPSPIRDGVATRHTLATRSFTLNFHPE